MRSAPSPRRCRIHFLGQNLAALFLVALEAVGAAIGRFADDIIEAGGRFRIGLQHLVIGPDIAGKQNADGLFAGLLDLDLDRGRAQEMAGIPVARANARHRVDPGFVRNSNELREAGLASCGRVDGLDLGPPALAIALVQDASLRFPG